MAHRANGEPTDTSPLTPALAYLAAGLSVVPIRRDGSKRASLPHLGSRTSKSWPANRRSESGFAAIIHPAWPSLAAPVSGELECIDFDAEADTIFPSWCDVAGSRVPGLLVRLSIARTPKPRLPCPLPLSRHQIPGNSKLAMDQAGKEVLIETRGEGGYGWPRAARPSATSPGCLYVHHSGPPLEHVQDISIAERYLLIRFAESFNRSPPPDTPKVECGPGLSPGDDFDQRGPDWPAILEPHGWAAVHHRGDVTYWRRPGKNGRGWSATTGACTSKAGRALFCVFSSNAAPFPGPEGGRACSSHDKFATHGAPRLRRRLFRCRRGHSPNRDTASSDRSGPNHPWVSLNGASVASGLPRRPRGQRLRLPRPDGVPREPYRIDASDENLAVLTAEAWTAIQRANSPPTLFRYGGCCPGSRLMTTGPRCCGP